MKRFQFVRQITLRLFAEFVHFARFTKRDQRFVHQRFRFRQPLFRQGLNRTDEWDERFLHRFELPGQSRTALRRRRPQQNMAHFAQNFRRLRDENQIGIRRKIGLYFADGGRGMERRIGQFGELRQILRKLSRLDFADSRNRCEVTQTCRFQLAQVVPSRFLQRPEAYRPQIRHVGESSRRGGDWCGRFGRRQRLQRRG